MSHQLDLIRYLTSPDTGPAIDTLYPTLSLPVKMDGTLADAFERSLEDSQLLHLAGTANDPNIAVDLGQPTLTPDSSPPRATVPVKVKLPDHRSLDLVFHLVHENPFNQPEGPQWLLTAITRQTVKPDTS